MAQIEFLSTAEDEKILIAHISKNKSIKCSVVENGRLSEWISLTDLNIPDYKSGFEICIWNIEIGNLKWLNKKPKIDFSGHGKLVKSVFTLEAWMKEKEGSDFNKMIDSENSPIIYYKRGELVYDYRLPNLILLPQSSVDYLGSDFKKWFNRISSWVRRNGAMVHNWKKENTKLRNDDCFLNSIYALPNAHKILELDYKKYAISINTRKYSE